MKILLISQYFWPEEFRINELAAMMAVSGHQITVLTGIPNYPGGRYFPGYGCLRQKKQRYKGIDIVRVPLIPRGKGGHIRLVLNYSSFALSASLLGPIKCRDAYDVVFVYEPSPITVGFPAIVMKKFKSAPILFWVQDLWPESLVATDAVHSNLILKIVDVLVRFIYARCDRILVQSRSFVDAIARLGVEPSKIEYFPNSAEAIFDNARGSLTEIPDVQFPEGFRIMFAGNIGAAQDFETILQTAELLREQENIHFVIVGDGRMLPWVRDQLDIRGLAKTVHLLGRHPLDSMPAFYARADVMLVTLRKDPIFALTIPAKVQSYLACSRPIVAALDGEGARVVEESGAGLACPAEDPQSLAKTILKVYNMKREEREEMALRGRAYFENNFKSDILLHRLDKWLAELMGKA
jgi:glycosyltransferase involved in cell wall biosynthesis